MDLKQLQTEHPELFSAVLLQGKTEGLAEGHAAGVKAEQKRALDHVKLGKACGDIETAHKAIESGASVADMQADYLAANMKRSTVETRQQESDGAGESLGAVKKPVAKDAEDEVAAELEKLMGAPDPKASK
jgi:hypothetical protein